MASGLGGGGVEGFRVSGLQQLGWRLALKLWSHFGGGY